MFINFYACGPYKLLHHANNSYCLCFLIFQIDTPMLASEWKRHGMLSHFTVVRKLDGGIFPMGFSKEATEKNSKAGSTVLSFESRQVFTHISYS